MQERYVADVTCYVASLARLFAEAVARGDFEEAEKFLTVVAAVMRDPVEVTP